MADNGTAASGPTVAWDDIGGVAYQRFKPAVGSDGVAVDVSAAFPMPTYNPDGINSGTITTTDAVLGTHNGLGAVLTGTPTAGSYVTYAVQGGESGFTLRLSGTFGGGTVWMESSVDSTNGIDGGWVTNLVRQSGVDITFIDASLTTPGVFRGVAAGYSYLRVRVTGATTPSIGVAFRASDGPSVTAQVASLPAGANVIGSVKTAPAATGTITSPALSTSSFTVLAANTARLGASVFNETGNLVYLALASTASATSYTVQIPPGGFYELANGYTGIITGISGVASGNLRVTELT